MKTLILALLLFVSSAITALGTEMTNGVFYANNPVECHLILQSGATTTNQLIAGKTYPVSDALVEFEVANETIYYLAGGPMIVANSNSVFSINMFDHEVNNLDLTPRKAEFGNHNISLTFMKGEFVVFYNNTNEYSSFSVMTPHTGREYASGRYVFVVGEEKTTVNIIEGATNAVKGKKKFTQSPMLNKSRTKTTTEPLTIEQSGKYTSIISDMEIKQNDVQFYIVNNQVVGIWMK